MSRYELRQGKFGMYFYDTLHETDMSLELVLDNLNYLWKLKNNALHTT